MSHKDPLMTPPHPVEYGTLKHYALGFAFSLLLTAAAYFLVLKRLLTGVALDSAVAILGLAQAALQLIFFLHALKEPRPRWNLIIFFFMMMVLVIIVFGSIWIMNNLNYNLMPAM